MIRAFIETSLIDWDGKLTSVLFFDRCNFRCPFCQNWELILHPENFPIFSENEILDKLKTKRNWIDGVVLTGGEPSLFFEDVFELAKKIKNLGLGVKLDTNGSFPERLLKLIKEKAIDYVAMDIKASLGHYSSAAGVQDARIIEKVRMSIKLLLNGELDYEFRTTCVPGFIDKDALREIGEEIRGAKSWVLQRFISKNAHDERLRGKEYSLNELKELLDVARQYVSSAKLR
ncbi:MAG: anaerobic ribonucleoside-triphosphate reductase activating protein [candidate division WOR-3 bacterium]